METSKKNINSTFIQNKTEFKAPSEDLDAKRLLIRAWSRKRNLELQELFKLKERKERTKKALVFD